MVSSPEGTPSSSMSSPVNSTTAMSLDQSVSKPPKRSRTTCMRLRTQKNLDKTIEFDDEGVPKGDNASLFSSYYAFVAKEHVKITYTSWHYVPKELKELLWKMVKDHWNIKDEKDVVKKKCITTMGERWKGFKTKLRDEYIKKADPQNPKSPCQHYNITEADWEEFKRLAETEEFKAMSLRGSIAAMSYTHHHRLGARGYKTAVKNWPADAVIASCVDSQGITLQFDKRSFKWLMARAIKTEDGCYFIPNEATRELLKRAESMAVSGSQNSITPKEVLSTVTGKPDHLGRLRGCSGWSTSSSVYGRAKKRKFHDNYISKEEHEKREAMVEARWQLKFQNLFEQLNIPMVEEDMGQEAQFPTQVEAEMGQEAQVPTQVKSNNLAEYQLHNIQVDTPCNLFLLFESGERTLVVCGMIILSKVGDKVHHEPLEPGQVKINVDDVLDGYRTCTVPFPLSDGTDRLGELMGNYLRWPAQLVELCEKSPQKANTKVSSAMSDNGREPLLADMYLQRLGKECNLLYNVLMAQPPISMYLMSHSLNSIMRVY